MGMEKLDDIAAWCSTHDAVVDVDLPAVMKSTAPKVLPKQQAQLALDTVKEISEPSEWAKEHEKTFQKAAAAAVKEHHDAGRSVVIWKDGKVQEVPPPAVATESSDPVKPAEKKIKTPKKEQNDPGSGSE